MPPIPSRMSSRELNLDHAPSARRAGTSAAAAVKSSTPASRSPRRSGVSAGRIILFGVVLLAVAVGYWWLECGRIAMAVPKVRSGKAMPPDQEAFNMVCFLATVSERELPPGGWAGAASILRQYDQKLMKPDTVELMSDMLSRYDELNGIEVAIAQRRKTADQESEAIRTQYRLNGAAGGAIKGRQLGTWGAVIVGAIGFFAGNAEADRITAPIMEAADNDIAEMRRQMAVLLTNSVSRLDAFRAGPTFQTFDRERLFDKSYLDLGAASGCDQAKLNAAFRCKVPELCVAIDCMSEHRNIRACNSGCIVEWPHSRIVDSKTIGLAYLGLASDACRAGKYKLSIALAEKGLEFDGNNPLLHGVLKLAKACLDKSKNTLTIAGEPVAGVDPAIERDVRDLGQGHFAPLTLELLAL